jgi:hypothetical protein
MSITTTKNIMDYVKDFIIQAGEEEWDTDTILQSWEEKNKNIEKIIKEGTLKTKKVSSPKEPTQHNAPVAPQVPSQYNAQEQQKVPLSNVKEDTVGSGATYRDQSEVLKSENEGIVFITGTSDYHDSLGTTEMTWQGQKKHKRDSIVTNGDGRIHVLYREKGAIAFTYKGTINNNRITLVERGDSTNSIPNTYSIQIIKNKISDVLLNDNIFTYQSGSRTKRDFHKTAARCIGLDLLDHNSSFPQGIYKCVKC